MAEIRRRMLLANGSQVDCYQGTININSTSVTIPTTFKASGIIGVIKSNGNQILMTSGITSIGGFTSIDTGNSSINYNVGFRYASINQLYQTYAAVNITYNNTSIVISINGVAYQFALGILTYIYW